MESVCGEVAELRTLTHETWFDSHVKPTAILDCLEVFIFTQTLNFSYN